MFFFCGLMLLSPLNYAEPTSGKPVVAVSLHPLALLIHDLAGNLVSVAELLPAGQEPHHVSLTFSQRRLIQEADLVLWIGPTLEGYLAKPLAQKVPDVLSLEGVAGGANSVDPHLWLNPLLVRDFAEQIIHLLQSRYPQIAPLLEKRLTAFIQGLDDQNQAIKSQFDEIHGGSFSFITEHDAYSHFTEYFGLQSAGSLSDSSDVAVGARTLAKIASRNDISCVVTEQAPGGVRARQMAERLSVPVVAIDPLGADIPATDGYLAFQRHLVEGFLTCFNSAGL